MRSVTIRRATAADYDAVGALTVAAYEALSFDEPLGDYAAELRDVGARAIDSVVLVAVDDDGRVLGSVTYVPSAERAMSEFKDADAASIRMLAVDPAHQGEGVGRALVLECVRLAREAGKAKVLLHSTVHMATAQALYRSIGFERTEDRDIKFAEPPYSEDHPFLLVAFCLQL